MSNLDKVYLKSLLSIRDSEKFLSHQINDSFLSSGYDKIYLYIIECFKKYGSIADVGHIEEYFSVDLKSSPTVSIEQAKNLIRARFGFDLVNENFKKINESFQSSTEKDIDRYLKDMISVVFDAEKKATAGVSSYYNLFDMKNYSQEVLTSGKPSQKSIDTPFPSLTERMGGMKPGDLITLAARAGIGKTFMLLQFMIHAANQGKKCLLITTEMSLDQIKNRFISLYGEIKVGKPPKNQLSLEDFSRFMEKVKEAREGSEIGVIDSGFSMTVEDIEIDILKNKPDFLCIDGFYILRTKNTHRDKFNRIAEIMDTIKGYALKYNIPILVTSQLNRGTGESVSYGKSKPKTPQIGGLERLAFSDNIAMVSDYVFFMDHPMTSERQSITDVMTLAPRKMRQVFTQNGFSDIHIKWDIHNIVFKEDLFWEHPDKVKEIEKATNWLK